LTVRLTAPRSVFFQIAADTPDYLGTLGRLGLATQIAADTPDYLADDLSGKGAEISGGRWNRKGTAVCYAASSRALACLESVVHLAKSPLPLNRHLVEIEVPKEVMDGAIVFTKSMRPGAPERLEDQGQEDAQVEL
jgi:RES domain-containing protein